MTELETFSPPDDLRSLADEAMSTAWRRAFPLEWQGKRVWVKLANPYNYYRWHALQKFLAKVLGIPLLFPTVSVGGLEGLKYEMGRLVELKGRGVRVPTPLAVTENWMVSGDLGRPLQDLLDEEAEPSKRQDLLVKGAKALAELHQKGEWHGSGQVRDLVETSEGIGFIDFEEDLLSVMTLTQAQARDVLLFLLSVARYASLDHNPLPIALKAYADNGPSEIWPELKRLKGLTGFAAFLFRPFRTKLGRDARQGLLAIEALRQQF